MRHTRSLLHGWAFWAAAQCFAGFVCDLAACGYPIGKSALAQARYQAAARIVAISRWLRGTCLAVRYSRDNTILRKAFIPARRMPPRARLLSGWRCADDLAGVRRWRASPGAQTRSADHRERPQCVPRLIAALEQGRSSQWDSPHREITNEPAKHWAAAKAPSMQQ